MKVKQDPLAWASHLDWMEGGGVEDSQGHGPARSAWISRIGPGLTVAIGIALAAMALSHLPVWPFTTAAGRHPLDPIMLAVILGMIAGNFGGGTGVRKNGAAFAVRKILPLGVVLLGARLDFVDLLAVGGMGILLSCLQVVAALALFAGLIRWWKLPLREGVLLGVGTAICGGTAIVAVAPVVRAKESEIAVTVATVTLIGLIAMFVLPAVAALVGLNAQAFGIWAGLTIHQTPQVIAAGFAHSAEAGETATIVKLARVCLLAPVVLAAGIWWRRSGAEAPDAVRPWWHFFPMFVLGFAGVALLRTLGLLPAIDVNWEASRLLPALSTKVALPEIFNTTSSFLLTIAMAGVGLETRWAALKRSSLRAVGAAGVATLVLGALALLAANGIAR